MISFLKNNILIFKYLYHVIENYIHISNSGDSDQNFIGGKVRIVSEFSLCRECKWPITDLSMC